MAAHSLIVTNALDFLFFFCFFSLLFFFSPPPPIVGSHMQPSRGSGWQTLYVFFESYFEIWLMAILMEAIL